MYLSIDVTLKAPKPERPVLPTCPDSDTYSTALAAAINTTFGSVLPYGATADTRYTQVWSHV